MENKRLGKFIKELRLKKGVSQEELAKAIKLSLNKIQKIEQGKMKVSTETIFYLHKYFNVPVEEILNVYLGKTEINTHNELLISLSNEKRKYNKFKKTITLVSIIFIILTSIISIYLYNNRDWGYFLNGESENFKYSNSMFIHDNGTYYLMFGQFEIKNNEIKEEDINYIELKCKDRLIIGSSNILTGYTRESKGYDELFPKNVAKNIDDWYYEITYLVNDEKIIERIDLVNKSL